VNRHILVGRLLPNRDLCDALATAELLLVLRSRLELTRLRRLTSRGA